MGNEISLKEVGSHDLFFFLLLRVSAARVKSAAMLYCFIWTGPTSGTLLSDVFAMFPRGEKHLIALIFPPITQALEKQI